MDTIVKTKGPISEIAGLISKVWFDDKPTLCEDRVDDKPVQTGHYEGRISFKDNCYVDVRVRAENKHLIKEASMMNDGDKVVLTIKDAKLVGVHTKTVMKCIVL